MHGGVVGVVQVVADGDGDRGAVGLGDLAGDGLHLQRPHVVGGGVDHIAGQGAGVDDAARLGEVQLRTGHQPRAGPAGLGLVAIEHLGPQAPGHGGLQSRGSRLGRRGDAVVAGRQLGRQGAEDHRVGALVVPQAEQHLADPSVAPDRDADLARAGLEVVQRRLGLQGGAAAGEEGLEVALAQGVDGRDLALGFGDQDVCHGGGDPG